ncbi:LOW QUALITY PROTEIN: cytochrome P450 315a1, mitochondrial [Panulirus ornatus]|uniref:LOW QUALITY PROTEIN: cytochrome P450 315a1, mitochondrial n=1 Tax=Panulirus ornatus TaxID=150431 RepID=UPI003A883199
MATVVPMLVRRHLRRVNSLLKSVQRRHRATLAATIENLKPSLDVRPLPPEPSRSIPSKLRTFEELPTPRGYPLLGTLPEFLAAGGVQHYHKYISQRHQELGGVFKETLGGSELVFVSDPAAVRQVFASEGQYPRHFIPEAWLLYNQDRQVRRGLFFMEGEEWKENRSVLNKRLLRPSAVAPHQAAFSQVADSLVDYWTQHFPGRALPNLEQQLYRWAIESLGVMVFGSRLGFLNHNSGGPRDSPSSSRQAEMEKFIGAIHGIFKETCAMGTFPPRLARALRFPVWIRFADSVDRALAAGKQLVLDGLKASRARQERGEAPLTLLDHLLQEDNLDESRIVCLLTDLFLAAADTTSHTAIWSLYLLGRHPKEAQRVRREILAATGGSGDVQGEHLASLPYLKAVVKETMRLYPVAPFQTRALDRDTQLSGHVVPAGTMVILSVYTTGRDPSHFTNPDHFCPERWLREVPETNLSSPTSACPLAAIPNTSSTSRLHSHAFIPFGVGARSCIGRRVVETQLHLLLAKLLVRSHLRVLNEVDMIMRMVGVTSEPVKLRIDPINNVHTTQNV